MATPPPPRPFSKMPPPPPGKIASKKREPAKPAQAEAPQKSRQRALVRNWIYDALHTYLGQNAGEVADKLEGCIFEMSHCDEKNREYREKAQIVKKRLQDPKYDYLKEKVSETSPSEFITALFEAKEESRVVKPPVGRGAPPKPNITLPPKLQIHPSPRDQTIADVKEDTNRMDQAHEKKQEEKQEREIIQREGECAQLKEEPLEAKQEVIEASPQVIEQQKQEEIPAQKEHASEVRVPKTKEKQEKINQLSKMKSPLPKYPSKVERVETSEEKLQESSRMRKKKAQNQLMAAIASYDPMRPQQSSKTLNQRGQPSHITQSFIYPSQYDAQVQGSMRERSPSNISTSSRPSESHTSEQQKKYASRYYSRSTYTPNKMAAEPFNAQEIIKSRMSNKGVPSSRVTNSIATTPEELENMKEAYKNKKKELEETKRALTKAELQLKGEKQKVTSLQNQNENLNRELHELKSSQNEQLNGLGVQLQQSQKELKARVLEVQSVSEKLRKVTQERDKEKQQLMEVTASFHKYKHEMDQTIQKLTSQREANQRQTRMPSVSGVDRLRKQAEIYEKQLEKQKQEILKLKEENSRLQRMRAEEDEEKSEESYSEQQSPNKQTLEMQQRNAESGTITFSSGSGLQEYQHLEIPPSSSGSADHRNHAIYPTLVNEDTGELINFEESGAQGVVGEDEERGEDQQQYMHLSESGGDFLNGENRNLRFFGWDQNEELKERESHKLEEDDFAIHQEQEPEERVAPPVAPGVSTNMSEVRSHRNETGERYHQSGSGGGKSDKRRERTGESGSTALIESNKRNQHQELKVQQREREEDDLMREEVRSGIGETHQREDMQQGSSGGNEPRSMLAQHDSSHALFQFLDEHVSPANMRVTSEIPSQSSGEAAPASAKTHADNSDQIMRAPPSSNIFESSSRSPATIPNLDQESTGPHGLFQFQASDRDNQVLSSSGMMRDPAAPQQRSMNHNVGATGNCDENNESLEEEQPRSPTQAIQHFHGMPNTELFQRINSQLVPEESEPAIPANLFDEPVAPVQSEHSSQNQLIDFFASIQSSPQQSNQSSNEVNNLDVFPSTLFGNPGASSGRGGQQQQAEVNPMAGLFEQSGPSADNPFDNLWGKQR